MAAVIEPQESDSVRDRKKRATRNALRRAARDLVGERGLHAVTAEEIAAVAGVSPRTFFNYFPTKEDAVIGYDPAKTAEMADRLRSRPAGESAFEALRATVLEMLPPSDVDPAEFLVRLQVVGADPHLVAHQVARFGDLERALTDALAERRGTEAELDTDAALVVACVLAAGRAALMAWCHTGGRDPLPRVLADHLDIVGAGLAAPERSVP
ncbi:MAG TPA: TetR family transcriptional regulator [Acidimicrobiales bacterium]|nr:TetR family transcriptional regulator [Acidimicrobiales bacterium]